MPKDTEHLHPEAQLYAHHAEALLAHAEQSQKKLETVKVDKKEVK